MLATVRLADSSNTSENLRAVIAAHLDRSTDLAFEAMDAICEGRSADEVEALREERATIARIVAVLGDALARTEAHDRFFAECEAVEAALS